MESCKYCSKQFNNKSNLIRHTKTVHKINCRGEIIIDLPREKFACELCDKQYLSKRSLELHINNVHLSEEEQLNELYLCDKCGFKSKHQSSLKRHIKFRHKEKNAESNENVLERFQCSICNASYKQEKHLNYHKRKQHKIGKPSFTFSRKCPLCSYVALGQNKKDIYQHFEKCHSIHIKSEHHNFHSTDEFEAWRNDTEKKTVASFKKTNSYIKNSKSIHTYQCHRGGFYKPKGINKRRLKMSGSSKINGFCPASIKATFKDSEVHVLYIPCHVGHGLDLQHIRLTKEERKSIAMQPASRKANEIIIEWIRSSEPEELEQLEEFKIKFSTDSEELLKMITTKEQMEYVNNEMNKIRTTVEAMNLPTSITAVLQN